MGTQGYKQDADTDQVKVRCEHCRAAVHHISQLQYFLDTDELVCYTCYTKLERKTGTFCLVKGCDGYKTREGLCESHWLDKQEQGT